MGEVNVFSNIYLFNFWLLSSLIFAVFYRRFEIYTLQVYPVELSTVVFFFAHSQTDDDRTTYDKQ